MKVHDLVSSINDVHVGAKQGDTSPPAPFGFVLALPCACALRAQIPGIVDAQFTIFAFVSRPEIAIHPSSARGTELALRIELRDINRGRRGMGIGKENRREAAECRDSSSYFHFQSPVLRPKHIS